MTGRRDGRWSRAEMSRSHERKSERRMTVPMFTPKSPQVEARQLTGGPESNAAVLAEWCGGSVVRMRGEADPWVMVWSLGFAEDAAPGDWIVHHQGLEALPARLFTVWTEEEFSDAFEAAEAGSREP